jgi:hypothetical protein
MARMDEENHYPEPTHVVRKVVAPLVQFPPVANQVGEYYEQNSTCPQEVEIPDRIAVVLQGRH